MGVNPPFLADFQNLTISIIISQMLHKKSRRSKSRKGKKRLPKISKRTFKRACKLVDNRTQKQMFTGIRFAQNASHDNPGDQVSTMDIFIRQKKLKIENLNENVPLSHYLDDQKISQFLGTLLKLHHNTLLTFTPPPRHNAVKPIDITYEI